MSAVLETIPLGFQWATIDPFLFCVHHDDAYPRANGSFGPDASLAGRDIGLLADPRVHQRHAGVAGMLIEGAQRRRLLTDVLFGTVEQERRSANRDQGQNATRQPQRT